MGNQSQITVAALSNGSSIIVGTNAAATGSAGGLSVQYSPELYLGTPTSVIIGNQTDNQDQPAVAGLTGDRLVIVWRDEFNSSAADHDILITVLNNARTVTIKAPFLASGSSSDETDPAVAALTTGGFVVTWTLASTVVAQRYDSDGNTVGNIITVANATTTARSKVVGLLDGGFAVVYQNATGDISLTVFDQFGAVRVPTQTVNTTTAGLDYEPAITRLSNGFIAVSWTHVDPISNNDLYTRVFDPNGVPVVGELRYQGSNLTAFSESQSSLTADTSGNFFAAWRDSEVTDGNGSHIGAQAFSLYRTTTGNDLSETLLGDEFWDVVYGLGERDNIQTFGGNDTAYGGAADDFIDGGADNDAIYGEGGADDLRGGAGIDVIFGGDDADIILGQNDNDYLYGNAGNDYIEGGAGTDVLSGDQGADRLLGGAGADILYIDELDTQYEGGSEYDYVIVATTTGVSVSFGAASGVEAFVGYTGNDTVDGTGSNVALYMLGGDGADSLIGSTLVDYIYGQGGDDRLFGGNGNDVLSGGAGADRLYGGDGSDLLYVDSLDTDYVGGTGTDYLIIEDATSDSYTLGDRFIEYAIGYTGNDTLDATGATHFIELQGQGGDDLLFAGNAGSILQGGTGYDRMFGGTGTDNFIGGAGQRDDFGTLVNGGVDFVYDFENGVDKFNFQYSGATSFAQLTLVTSGTWIGIRYATGTMWVNNAAGQIDATDFLF